MSKPINIELLMNNIFINLLRKYFFYGSVISQLTKVYDDSIETMAVGKNSGDDLLIKLYIATSYVEKIVELANRNEEKVVKHFTEVIKHEIHHLIFEHLNLKLPDQFRRTIACELSANSYVERNNLLQEGEEKPGVFPEDYDLPPKLSAIDYYNKLKDNKKFKKQENQRHQAMSQLSDMLDAIGSDNHCIDNHGKWKGVEGDETAREMIKDIIRQANDSCKKVGDWGEISGDIVEAISNSYEHQKNIIPWQVVLKNFLASSSENILDYTMKRRSKRYGTRPGTKKDDVLNIAIGIDTSGSINNKALQMFFDELYWMQKSNSKMTVFEWDTKINKEYPFKLRDYQISGRGGTNPIPVLEEISERRFDCLIMFTDFGFAEIEKYYNIPILWVVTDAYMNYNKKMYIPVKQGIILAINENKDGFHLVEIE